MKFILIVSTGRSASTTLQRIINTIPNSNICGENGNLIIGLLTTYVKFKKLFNRSGFIDKYIEGETKKKPCWYNSINKDLFISNLRKTIMDIFINEPNVRVIGFKEIRWLDYMRTTKCGPQSQQNNLRILLKFCKSQKQLMTSSILPK